ncbi:ExbD/TolR family protein [Hwangdonia sp.]|uniref:ExbD/TolR family protein n=1 Tax=Hwangdonia sp. TaxID=1883432 RepID=UPI003AB423F3
MNRTIKFSIYLLIGVALLLVLFQLVRLEKNRKLNSINLTTLEVEKDSIASKSMMIKISDSDVYFLDGSLVKFEDLENRVLMKRNNDSIKTIVIKAEKSVQVKNIVEVMDIANRNKFKVIFSVKPD